MIFFHNVAVNSNIIEEKAGMKMAEDRARQIRLNEYQRAAVLDESPACVVNANVGSGKTTVLIEKILYLHLERQDHDRAGGRLRDISQCCAEASEEQAACGSCGLDKGVHGHGSG